MPQGLFRCASKTEVGNQTPVLVRANLLEEDCSDATRNICESIFQTGRIGQYDAKKNGRLAARVLSNAMPDPNDFVAEFLDRVGNILGKLSLIDNTARNYGHIAIIARLEGSSIATMNRVLENGTKPSSSLIRASVVQSALAPNLTFE